MSVGKKRAEQHLIDQDGIKLLRANLPRHWLLREYRPDYGLDFTIEIFKEANEGGAPVRAATYETLGEHVFVQLKSAAEPDVYSLDIYGRSNVEKGPEQLNRKDKIERLRLTGFNSR